MRISDWSSDVCSSDLGSRAFINDQACSAALLREIGAYLVEIHGQHDDRGLLNPRGHRALLDAFGKCDTAAVARSEEHTSELQSLMRISYAVFCLKKKNTVHNTHTQDTAQRNSKRI